MNNPYYGQLPTELGIYEIECREMMFYQYLPIKMKYDIGIVFEPRLKPFEELIRTIDWDFIQEFGISEYKNSYMYLTVKHMYQVPFTSFNRMGYHSDGFLTDDINYIWCDNHPTIFNKTQFNLTLDDTISMKEMEYQAKDENEVSYQDNQLLRLDQYNIHKVACISKGCMRTFLKVSFSKDKYDLVGNSHNHLLDYRWDMKERGETRNIPQSILK